MTQAQVEPKRHSFDQFISWYPENSQVRYELHDRLIVEVVSTNWCIAQQLWVLILESKSTIAFPVALPQLMTYMMANPNPEHPVYGLIGNGDEFMFIKMLTEGVPQYDLSNIFSLLLPRRNQLYDVLSILKRISQIMGTNIGGNE